MTRVEKIETEIEEIEKRIEELKNNSNPDDAEELMYAYNRLSDLNSILDEIDYLNGEGVYERE